MRSLFVFRRALWISQPANSSASVCQTKVIYYDPNSLTHARSHEHYASERALSLRSLSGLGHGYSDDRRSSQIQEQRSLLLLLLMLLSSCLLLFALFVCVFVFVGCGGVRDFF